MRRIQQHKRKEKLKERHKGKIYSITPVSVLCFIDLVSRYNRVKKNQLEAQLTLNPKRVE